MNYTLHYFTENTDHSGWTEQVVTYDSKELAMKEYKRRTTGDFWLLNKTDTWVESNKGTIIAHRNK